MLFLTRRKGEYTDIIDRRTRKVLCTFCLSEILPDGTVRLAFNADPDLVDIVRDNAKQKERRNDRQPIGGNR